MRKSIIALCIIPLLLGSCGIFKKKSKKAEVSSETPIFYKDWTYLSARLDAETMVQGSKQNLGISLRMKKDSITWFSVSAMFGIQVAKGLMTKDSVWILNKFSKEYYAMSMADISRLTGADVSLSQLQNALIGTSIFDPPTKYNKDSNLYVGVQAPFTNVLELALDNSISKSSISKAKSSSALSFGYENKIEAGSIWVPEKVSMDGKSDKKNIHIDMQFKTANDNIITSFPFDIPSGYTKK